MKIKTPKNIERRLAGFLISALLFVFIFAFQNCSGFVAQNSMGDTIASSASSDPTACFALQPSARAFVADLVNEISTPDDFLAMQPGFSYALTKSLNLACNPLPNFDRIKLDGKGFNVIQISGFCHSSKSCESPDLKSLDITAVSFSNSQVLNIGFYVLLDFSKLVKSYDRVHFNLFGLSNTNVSSIKMAEYPSNTVSVLSAGQTLTMSAVTLSANSVADQIFIDISGHPTIANAINLNSVSLDQMTSSKLTNSQISSSANWNFLTANTILNQILINGLTDSTIDKTSTAQFTSVPSTIPFHSSDAAVVNPSNSSLTNSSLIQFSNYRPDSSVSLAGAVAVGPLPFVTTGSTYQLTGFK